MDAIGAYQQIGVDRLCIGKASRDTGVRGFQIGKGVAEADGIVAQALLHRAGQQQLEFAAMNRNLRPAIAGGDAARLAPDRSAPFVAIKKLVDFHARAAKLVEQSQFREFPRGMRQHIDAHAQRRQLRGGFIDDGLETAFVKAEGSRQPAHAGADNENARHVRRKTSRRTLRARRSPTLTRSRLLSRDSLGLAVRKRMAVRK